MKQIPYPCPENRFLIEHIELLAYSYRQLLGVPLLGDCCSAGENLAEQLFNAPFALVSHNTAPDPVFNYANLTALSLFEFSWREFTALPSRLSAEPVNRLERGQLLARVTEHGFINDYCGVRISRTGKRFRISNAVVWNVMDRQDNYQGQAACFSEWEFLN